jgi:hypothetical protein
MTEITNPYIYIPDPDKSRALFNAQLYFGLPDTDPTIASNQKLVRGIQEDGIPVSLAQPVLTNSGGVPELNGKPLRLDISGDYSFAARDRLDVPKYYAPNVENPESGSDGFSGVVVIEDQELSLGQLDVTFSNVGANESVFYLQTNIGDQGFLAKDIDYTVKNSTTITLTSSKNAGDKVIGRQNDPTGQLVPVNDDAESLLVFSDLADAAASAAAGNLVAGNTVTLNGNAVSGDGLGGDKYLVQVTGPANDGVNYLDLNGTLQLALQNNYYRFQNYSETIAVASSAAGVLNINLNSGSSQQIILTESISSLAFVNFNPGGDYSSTVTLKVQQDGVGGWGITWPASIVWAGGIAPSVTATANAIDMYGFTTYDAGVSWFGFSLGADFS